MNSHTTLVESLGSQGPYWLIRYSDSSEEAGVRQERFYSFELGGFGEVLPVFGSEEEATCFLRGTQDRGSDLEIMPVARARLASALLDTLAGVNRVAFDPLPEPHLAQTVRLASLGRGAFVDLILGRGRAWSRYGAYSSQPPPYARV